MFIPFTTFKFIETITSKRPNGFHAQLAGGGSSASFIGKSPVFRACLKKNSAQKAGRTPVRNPKNKRI
jgi:hypothetical protein